MANLAPTSSVTGTGINTENPQTAVQPTGSSGIESPQNSVSSSNLNTSGLNSIPLTPSNVVARLSTSKDTPKPSSSSWHKPNAIDIVIIGVLLAAAIIWGVYISLSSKKTTKYSK